MAAAHRGRGHRAPFLHLHHACTQPFGGLKLPQLASAACNLDITPSCSDRSIFQWAKAGQGFAGAMIPHLLMNKRHQHKCSNCSCLAARLEDVMQLGQITPLACSRYFENNVQRRFVRSPPGSVGSISWKKLTQLQTGAQQILEGLTFCGLQRQDRAYPRISRQQLV